MCPQIKRLLAGAARGDGALTRQPPPARARCSRSMASRTARVNDPFVPARAGSDLGREPRPPSRRATVRAGARGPGAITAASRHKRKPGPTRGQRAVGRALHAALDRAGSRVTRHRRFSGLYKAARAKRKRLRGARGRELGSVIATLEGIALRRGLTGSRHAAAVPDRSSATSSTGRASLSRATAIACSSAAQSCCSSTTPAAGLQLQPLVNFKKANLMHGAVRARTRAIHAVSGPGRAAGRDGPHRLAPRRASAPGSTTSASAAAARRGSAAWPRPPASRPSAAPRSCSATSGLLRYAREALGAFITRRRRPACVTAGPAGWAPLPAVLVRAAAVHPERLPAVGDRALRLLEHHRRPRRREPCTRARSPRRAGEVPLHDIGDWSLYSLGGRDSTRTTTSCCASSSAALCGRLRHATLLRHRRPLPPLHDRAGGARTCSGPSTATQGEETRVRFSVTKLSAVQIMITRDGRTALDEVATFRRGERLVRLEAARQRHLRDPPGGEGAAHRARAAHPRQRRDRVAAHSVDLAATTPNTIAPMAPRTILYTGKGGVGKTSVAAATARRCAAAGLRTVVLSTDPAHSLSDSLELRAGREPTEVATDLWAQEVQAQEEMERNWDAVSGWLGELLADRGVDPISAEELTVPPGMDELFSLLQIKRHHEADEFDAIVVDCAPTGETLRLLSFPDVCTLVAREGVPVPGQLVAAARPLARGLLDLPLPGDAVFDDVERLVRNLVAMNGILRDRSHHLGPAGDEPGPDGGQGVDAHLHLPQPVRLPDRRRGGEPRASRRRPARATSPPGATPSRSTWSSCARPSRPCPILTAPLSSRREVIGAGDARRAGRRAVRRPSPPRRAARGALPGAVERERPRHAAAAAAVRRARRHRAEEDRARGDRAGRRARSGLSSCRPRWRPTTTERRPLRGRRARGLLRKARRWTHPQNPPR